MQLSFKLADLCLQLLHLLILLCTPPLQALLLQPHLLNQSVCCCVAATPVICMKAKQFQPAAVAAAYSSLHTAFASPPPTATSAQPVSLLLHDSHASDFLHDSYTSDFLHDSYISVFCMKAEQLQPAADAAACVDLHSTSASPPLEAAFNQPVCMLLHPQYLLFHKLHPGSANQY